MTYNERYIRNATFTGNQGYYKLYFLHPGNHICQYKYHLLVALCKIPICLWIFKQGTIDRLSKVGGKYEYFVYIH